jgi:NADPH:quinone reductase-like Zn-dependent oxidoreductase
MGSHEEEPMSRAALYDQTGGPDVLYVAEVADAEPGPGKVVLRVRAAGLNPFDAKVRGGFIPSHASFPRRIGGDVAGTVESVGEGAVYWDGSPVAVGDEVMGRAAGAVAERVVASASELTPRPDGLPAEVAGGLNVAALTALSCRVTVPVEDGDTLLVGGAAGAVGFIAAQLAIAAGARVVGTASERNHDLLRSVGVEPVAYGEGLAGRLEPFGPFTAVYDCHGRDALDAGIELGVPVGRMVAIAAYAAGDELGVQPAEREARTAENLAWMAEDIAAGRIVAPVAATYPLDEVVAAFAALEGPHAPGKIVVTP